MRPMAPGVFLAYMAGKEVVGLDDACFLADEARLAFIGVLLGIPVEGADHVVVFGVVAFIALL